MILKKLIFVFENCEVLCLDAKDIILHSNRGIVSKFSGTYSQLNSTDYLENVFISVHKDAKPIDESVLFGDFTAKLRTDVTSIIYIIEGESGEEERTFVLDWEEEGNPMYCKNQRVLSTPDGHQVFIHSSNHSFEHMVEHVDLCAMHH